MTGIQQRTGVGEQTGVPHQTPVADQTECPWCRGTHRVAGEPCVGCASQGWTLNDIGFEDWECVPSEKTLEGMDGLTSLAWNKLEMAIDWEPISCGKAHQANNSFLGAIAVPKGSLNTQPVPTRVDIVGRSTFVEGDHCSQPSGECDGSCERESFVDLDTGAIRGELSTANQQRTQDATQLQDGAAGQTRCVDCGVGDRMLLIALMQAMAIAIDGRVYPLRCNKREQHRFRGSVNPELLELAQRERAQSDLAQRRREQLARERGLR